MPSAEDLTEPQPFRPISLEGLGCATLLVLMAETRMETGVDADGSGALGRCLGVLAEFDQLSRCARAPGMPWDASAARHRALLRQKLLEAEPIMARLARRQDQR